MSSRIVVKNLPKKISAEKLNEIFSEKGHITDLQPKYTKSGVFRQFAFIGYKTEQEAQAAKDYFHNTFIQTSKIKVDICHPLGDEKTKAWSKYSKQKTVTVKNDQSSRKQKVDTKEKIKELEQDPQFKEFMQVTGSSQSKPVWCDLGIDLGDAGKKQEVSDKNEENSSDEGSDENSENDVPSSKKMSDMEYLRSKIGHSQNSPKNDESMKKNKQAKAQKKLFTVKLKKLPYLCKKKNLKAFFHPLKLASIRIPPKTKGFAYVGFSNEKDMKKALNKNRGFLDGHRVDVILYEKKEELNSSQRNFEEINHEEGSERIAETGRLFVRNLCFSVTEEELKEVFSKFGPIAEINIPSDFHTKQSVGYAHVSYVFAEHAVKAYTELDGTIFQGRLFHIIPGKSKKEIEIDPQEMTFKQRKAAKEKALAHSSHNWNTLFLGVNAVADSVADRYDVSKANLLSNETRDSVVVRMALGETQLVIETRKFLIDNDVELDAFSQPAAKRSKSVIIVKHLPARTTSEQLANVFSKYGQIKKLVLPPSGITALIEFEDANNAKTAFNKLAYSRFANKPLYLEWAPMNAFTDKPPKENVVQEEDAAQPISTEENKEVLDKTDVVEQENNSEEEEEEEDTDDLPPEGTTIFVKNLNFETTEESLKKHFKKCGPLHSISISKKKDLKSGKFLSMGFGFVQYKQKSSAQEAIQDLQSSSLDGHALELKFSNRATLPEATTLPRKKAKMTKQKTSKICVRNIPFEATVKEIRSIFEGFGELKFVRLPKKAYNTGHRGFGFVEFVQKTCAKRAFEALCHSTHILGRRLVLEWAAPDSEDVDDLRKRAAKDLQLSGPERRVKKTKLNADAMLAKPGAD